MDLCGSTPGHNLSPRSAGTYCARAGSSADRADGADTSEVGAALSLEDERPEERLDPWLPCLRSGRGGGWTMGTLAAGPVVDPEAGAGRGPGAGVGPGVDGVGAGPICSVSVCGRSGTSGFVGAGGGRGGGPPLRTRA